MATFSSLLSLVSTSQRWGRLFVRRFAEIGGKPEGKIPKQTIQDIKNKLSLMMYSPDVFDKLNQEKRAIYKLLPSTQEEMPTRTMQDSYDECIVPLSKEPKFQNRYATVKGYIRAGRILEDADVFAVWLCLKYIKNVKSENQQETPYTIVTILVDDMSFEPVRPKAWNDLRLSGHIVWAGRTSLEARIIVDFYDKNEWKLFTKAYFVLGARNAESGKGAFVNKLTPNGVFEQEQWQRALTRKKRRTADEHISLLKNPPHADEQQMIFEKYMNTLDPNSFSINLSRRKLPDNATWMADTVKFTELHPHPEYRNHQNTFFGGTLMRLATELAWLTAFTHAHERPILTYVSKVEFRVPVILDSFLKFTALVTHVEERFINVTVVCESTEIYTRVPKATNFFHFIFQCKTPPKLVMPSTYMESLLHVQSIRFFWHFGYENPHHNNNK